MSHPIRAIAVQTCCVFTALAATGFQCGIAAAGNTDFDSGLDAFVQVSHASGNPPFPRFDPSKLPFATQPPLDNAFALCMPDLYCSLEDR